MSDYSQFQTVIDPLIARGDWPAFEKAANEMAASIGRRKYTPYGMDAWLNRLEMLLMLRAYAPAAFAKLGGEDRLNERVLRATEINKSPYGIEIYPPETLASNQPQLFAKLLVDALAVRRVQLAFLQDHFTPDLVAQIIGNPDCRKKLLLWGTVAAPWCRQQIENLPSEKLGRDWLFLKDMPQLLRDHPRHALADHNHTIHSATAKALACILFGHQITRTATAIEDADKLPRSATHLEKLADWDPKATPLPFTQNELGELLTWLPRKFLQAWGVDPKDLKGAKPAKGWPAPGPYCQVGTQSIIAEEQILHDNSRILAIKLSQNAALKLSSPGWTKNRTLQRNLERAGVRVIDIEGWQFNCENPKEPENFLTKMLAFHDNWKDSDKEGKNPFQLLEQWLDADENSERKQRAQPALNARLKIEELRLLDIQTYHPQGANQDDFRQKIRDRSRISLRAILRVAAKHCPGYQPDPRTTPIIL